jgi:hypothetical protein
MSQIDYSSLINDEEPVKASEPMLLADEPETVWTIDPFYKQGSYTDEGLSSVDASKNITLDKG